MIYRELPLPETLRRFAFCAWQFVVEPADPPLFAHQVPPDGTTGLTLIRSPEGHERRAIIGPMLTAFTVPVAFGFAYAGLRLRPEMSRIVLGSQPEVGSSSLSEGPSSFDFIWEALGSLADGRADWRPVEAALATREESDRIVSAAVDRIVASGGNVSVTALAALAQLSERQFRRRFHAATGIAPKQYGDVQRVRRALILALDDPDWAGIAHDSGFADQPHMVRDVKLRFGAAPKRVSGYFGGIRHELLEQGDVRNLQAGTARAA